MTVALMWEARAATGRGEDLLTWAREQSLAQTPARRETFRAPQDRVLVIMWWETSYDDPGIPELADPPGDLVNRPVHRWRFESLGADRTPA